MGVPFDFAPDRPEHIDAILNGLDRYNPETTGTFQDYVMQQCETQTYDCYANLALLKLALEHESLPPIEASLLALSENIPNLTTIKPTSTVLAQASLTDALPAHSYQFNPHLARDETITNILVKSLTVFPSPDFSLCLSLLPPHILAPLSSTSNANPAAGDPALSEAVQKLNILNNLLGGADYAGFWATLDSDDLYADLIADVAGFEELMCVRIAVTVSQAVREIERPILETWLNKKGQEFENFVGQVCGWSIEGDVVKVPLNKENEAKGTVVRENVKFDQFSRLIRRAYEQPA
ncbi:eukaryotic translation initiation factor-like protein 3 subunit K [Macrophomina phaseolina]|uniref:Eukaryotic translation initiation factor 3 subunit K n=1 Tax=Macrophomina phaseolina TaxID=35725 RepID=A0ABQ8G598_9PEZI|nr:eukaryotic translation initiation factor-like protein 3 subunit K [Macrophomina phaseolina]